MPQILHVWNRIILNGAGVGSRQALGPAEDLLVSALRGGSPVTDASLTACSRPGQWFGLQTRSGAVNSASVSPGQTVPTLSGSSLLPRHANLHHTEVRSLAKRPRPNAPVGDPGGRHSPPHLPINLPPQTSTTRLCSSSHPSKFSVCPPCSGPTRLTRMGDTNTSLHPGASHWLRLAGAPAGTQGRAGRSQPGSRIPG